MNLKREQFNRELSIKIGFFIEMLSFVLFGMFALISIKLSLFFMILGVIAATITTSNIEKNAVENFKWGLE